MASNGETIVLDVEKIFGYCTIQETIRFKKNYLILGGVVRRYNRNGKLREERKSEAPSEANVRSWSRIRFRRTRTHGRARTNTDGHGHTERHGRTCPETATNSWTSLEMVTSDQLRAVRVGPCESVFVRVIERS